MITKKHLFVLHVLLAGIAVVPGYAAAQSSATGTADAKATIIRPITISKVNDLSFGKVVASGSSGTVVLSTADSRTAADGATIMATQTGTVAAANFTVGGEGAASYSVTLPGSAVTMTSGSDTMTATAFTSDPGTSAGAGLLSGSAGAGGTQTLKVGATLNVGASQAAGNYSGAFNVTVAYN